MSARNRHLAGYTELQSGCHIVYATPRLNPTLWDDYLLGALESYGRFGVQSVLEYDLIRDGSSTAMFVAALDESGRVVGGLRAQGRYSSPGQAHAVIEWAGQPGEVLLWGEIEGRLPSGVLEMKSGWVDEKFPGRRSLTAAMARAIPHVMHLMDARYALCTVAEHAVGCWETTGARASSMIPAIPYPDDRYRTVPMWWDRETVRDLSTQDQWARTQTERDELDATRASRERAEISERTAA